METDEVDGLIADAKRVVQEKYSLGNLLSIEVLKGGYINKTLLIIVSKDGKTEKYILRKYNSSTASEADVQFEHSVIRHVRTNGFSLAPDVIKNVDGRTYIRDKVDIEGREVTGLWAVFECLQGDVRYAFFDTNLSCGELNSAASTLARLHHAGRGFYKARDINRTHPQIMDFLPTFRQKYAEYKKQVEPNCFDSHFREYRDAILKKVDQVSIPDVEFTKLPVVAIHGDYHQGNLTFEGNEVVGVFDFDWTRIDLRLFDLAQSIIYFCACWEGEGAGTIDRGKCFRFVNTYHRTHIDDGTNGELTKAEQTKFPLMMEMANQYILFCIIRFFYESEEAVAEECLVALSHYINIMNWLSDEQEELKQLLAEACS